MKRWAVLFGLLVLGTILAADLGLLGIARRLHSIPFADKLGHFVLFGLLNLLVIRATQQSRPGRGKLHTAAGCSLLLLALAGLEELSQLYISGRTFSAWDFAASAAGIAAFGLASAFMPALGGGSQNNRVTDRRV